MVGLCELFWLVYMDGIELCWVVMEDGDEIDGGMLVFYGVV